MVVHDWSFLSKTFILFYFILFHLHSHFICLGQKKSMFLYHQQASWHNLKQKISPMYLTSPGLAKSVSFLNHLQVSMSGATP